MQKPTGLDCCYAEYLLNLQDEVIHSFVTDHRIKAAGVKTNCNIELTKRILNRKVNGFKWVKYSILRITGPDEASIGQCNKLIERVYPPYKYRKEYFRRAPVVLYTGDVMPDNTSLYFSRQRTGRTLPVCGEMRVESPYEVGRPRNLDSAPWKGSKVEEAGVYYPSSHGNENLFKFYNLGKMSSRPLQYNQEGMFNPPLVSPFEKRGITPSCFHEYQAAGVSKHLKNMAFGKIGQMPPPEMDTERSESRRQQTSPRSDRDRDGAYGQADDYMGYSPESPQPHYSDVSQNSNQSASSGGGNDERQRNMLEDDFLDNVEKNTQGRGAGSLEKENPQPIIISDKRASYSRSRSPEQDNLSRKTSEHGASQVSEGKGKSSGRERSGQSSDKHASQRSDREKNSQLSERPSQRQERGRSDDRFSNDKRASDEKDRQGDQFSEKRSDKERSNQLNQHKTQSTQDKMSSSSKGMPSDHMVVSEGIPSKSGPSNREILTDGSERKYQQDSQLSERLSQRQERGRNDDRFSNDKRASDEKDRQGDQFSDKRSDKERSNQLNQHKTLSTQDKVSSMSKTMPSDHVVVSERIPSKSGHSNRETLMSDRSERRYQQDSSQLQSARLSQRNVDESRYIVNTPSSRVVSNEGSAIYVEKPAPQSRPTFQGNFGQIPVAPPPPPPPPLPPPPRPYQQAAYLPQDAMAYHSQYNKPQTAVQQQNMLGEPKNEGIPTSYYGDMIIKDRLPIGHNDPVIIMVDGQDIIMTGNTAMSMTGNEHGKFVMNLGTEDYNISISGDRERLRYMKSGTRNQNQNAKSNFCDALRSNFQPCLNHVQVIV